MMNPTNKRSFIHKANKNRAAESDIEDKFDMIDFLHEEFGQIALTDEIIPIPNGIAEYRQPDLLIKNTEPQIIIELMGGIHGADSETTRRRKDDEKLEDYNRVASQYKVMLLFAEQTGNYNREKVLLSLLEQRLNVNEAEAISYTERKQRCQRY